MIAKFFIFLAMMLAAASAGYGYGYGKGVAAGLSASQKTIDAATTKATDSDSTLTEIRKKLGAMKTDHAVALDKAQKALGVRDTQVNVLKAALKAEVTTLKKAVDDDPHCQGLARLPVCDAVADRLWPAAAAPTKN